MLDHRAARGFVVADRARAPKRADGEQDDARDGDDARPLANEERHERHEKRYGEKRRDAADGAGTRSDPEPEHRVDGSAEWGDRLHGAWHLQQPGHVRASDLSRSSAISDLAGAGPRLARESTSDLDFLDERCLDGASIQNRRVTLGFHASSRRVGPGASDSRADLCADVAGS